MSEQGQIHSTGRGGAGNIGADPNVYVDGGIVREGVAGEAGRVTGGEYSAGRGGAGNMVNPPQPSAGPGTTVSEDVVPETAVRSDEGYENYHTGRGGQGNVHRDQFGGHSHAQKSVQEHGSLLEKAKHAIGLAKKKDHE